MPEGYKLLHVPRSGKRGGGVAVQYKMKVETTITATSFESITVLVNIASYTLRLIVIYRIPPSQQNKLPSPLSLPSSLTWLSMHRRGAVRETSMYTGINLMTESASLFETFNLVQHVTTATHTEGHILDLIVTRQEEDLVASCGVGDFIADHRAILVQLNWGKSHPIRKIVSFSKIKSLNSALLEHDIMTSDLHNAELDNIDDAVAAYNIVLCGLLDKYAPFKLALWWRGRQHPGYQQISFKLSVNEFGGSQV